MENILRAAYEVALKDIGRYYFIAYTLIKNPDAYASARVSPDGTTFLLLRKTGNLQVLTEGECVTPIAGQWLVKALKEMPWAMIICLRMHIEFISTDDFVCQMRKGSHIARCSPSEWIEPPLKHLPCALRTDALEQVVALYDKVFPGYAPLTYMVEKLEKGRGRGYILEDGGRCLAVAQSDFECDKGALIVGVASDEAYRGLGYGEACMVALGKALIAEGKTLYLLYENPIAGHLYKKLGFVHYDRLYHFERK